VRHILAILAIGLAGCAAVPLRPTAELDVTIDRFEPTASS
jgi:hypothetical protein